MRAVSYAQFGGPEVLYVAEVPVPEPGPGQVRVRVAASVVHPVDLMIRSGRFPAPLPTGLPYTPGWDAAGTVDAVGPSVAGFTIGDEVIGFSPWLQTTVGAHAEYVVLDAAWLTSAPAGVPATAAATLPTNGLAAAQALDLLALPAGSTVLVTGAAGQVGGFVLALARAAGLHATGLAGAGDREFVESLGAAYLSRSDTPTGTFDAVIDLAVVGPALLDLVRDGGGYVAASPRCARSRCGESGRSRWRSCRTAPGWPNWSNWSTAATFRSGSPTCTPSPTLPPPTNGSPRAVTAAAWCSSHDRVAQAPV